jgi:mannose-1-phosphate guanylyltransferase
LQQISEVLDTPKEKEIIESVWHNLLSETIDYGVMEGAEQVVVLPAAELNWSDVGSWDSLFDVLPADQNGNIVMGGAHIGLETHESLVYVSQEHRLIVTIGVDDLVVVDTGDVLLVCRKDQAQKVRQVVDQLKKSGDTYI